MRSSGVHDVPPTVLQVPTLVDAGTEALVALIAPAIDAVLAGDPKAASE